MIFLKKFSELQEHTDKQLNKIRKTMYNQKKKFNKEIEIIKKRKGEKERIERQPNRNHRAEKIK